MKCARCGKNDVGYSKGERNLQCDVCLGIRPRVVEPPISFTNDAGNMAVVNYFCPKCRAIPGRVCVLGVGGWTAAQWIHRARRDLAFKTSPTVANYIQGLFEIADRDTEAYAQAWQTLQAALAKTPK
jgi:hypothetical protein